MDHLCPQLDIAFTASFAALPRLAEIATAGRPETVGWVLLAAGAIASCSPGLSDADSPLTVFSAPIAVLRNLTDRRLSQPTDAEEYVNLLQALLSFEGVAIWDRCLDGLQTGEYEVDCPYCGVDMFVVIGQDDSFCRTDDYALWGDCAAGRGRTGSLPTTRPPPGASPVERHRMTRRGRAARCGPGRGRARLPRLEAGMMLLRRCGGSAVSARLRLEIVLGLQEPSLGRGLRRVEVAAGAGHPFPDYEEARFCGGQGW